MKEIIENEFQTTSKNKLNIKTHKANNPMNTASEIILDRNNSTSQLGITWQYFRPLERPSITYHGATEDERVKLQIDNGIVRDYEQVNQIDDIKHMKSGDYHLQAKHVNTYGLGEDFWEVRAVSENFIDEKGKEFGSEDIRVTRKTGELVAESGIRGTGREKHICTVCIPPFKDKSIALDALSRLIDFQRMNSIYSKAGMQFTMFPLEIKISDRVEPEESTAALEEIRDYLTSESEEIWNITNLPF